MIDVALGGRNTVRILRLHSRDFLHLGDQVLYLGEEELHLLQEQCATHSLDNVALRYKVFKEPFTNNGTSVM